MPSELPVVARGRHHWVVLFRKPHLVLTVALLVLLAAAVFDPNPMAWLFLIVLSAAAYLRWQSWRAEWIIVTQRRIIRVRGIPETTSSEASLRLDRISGAVLVQTVTGKLLDYGSIELEAPGQHPDVRRLDFIANPQLFYSHLRRVIFDDNVRPDRARDSGGPGDFVTAPLPPMQPPSPRDQRPRLR
jgi:hypothetical protein